MTRWEAGAGARLPGRFACDTRASTLALSVPSRVRDLESYEMAKFGAIRRTPFKECLVVCPNLVVVGAIFSAGGIPSSKLPV